MTSASSMVSGATDINRDPDCGRDMDPDMVLDCSPGLDGTMAPADNSDHPNCPVPGGGTGLRHQDELFLINEY